MRVFAIAMALALAGCVTKPGPNGNQAPAADNPNNLEAKESARRAFENFRTALVDKDAKRVLSMMSLQMVTNWVYARMADSSDEMFKTIKERLDSGAKIEIEYWFRRNKDVRLGADQPSLLPEQIFRSQWIVDLWAIYYMEAADQQKRHAEIMEIAEIYPDGNGVTITVRMQGQAVMMYGLVNENAAWKLDHYVQQPSRDRK